MRPGHTGPSSNALVVVERLFAEWNGGKGTSKGRIEMREWGDTTAHGRRFDRFIHRTLRRSTSCASRQTSRIGDLKSQLRRLGVAPAGVGGITGKPNSDRVRCLFGRAPRLE